MCHTNNLNVKVQYALSLCATSCCCCSGHPLAAQLALQCQQLQSMQAENTAVCCLFCTSCRSL